MKVLLKIKDDEAVVNCLTDESDVNDLATVVILSVDSGTCSDQLYSNTYNNNQTFSSQLL